jgi:hypothetical protein
VKRIITNNNKTLNNMEKLILASGTILTILAVVAFSPGHANVKKETAGTSYAIVATTSGADVTIKEIGLKSNANATSPKHNYSKVLLQRGVHDTSKIHYRGVIDGKEIQLTEEDGQIKELYVDGKKIPGDQYGKYATIIDKIHQGMRENAAKLKMESNLLQKEKEEMEQQQIAEMKETKEMKEQSDLMKEDFSKTAETMKKEQAEMQNEMNVMSKKNGEKMQTELLKMHADLIKQQKQLQLKAIEFQKQAEKMKLRQEEFDEMLRDSIRVKRMTRVRPAIYLKPLMPVKPEVVASSEILAEPVVIQTLSLSVRPVLKVSSNSISNDIICDLEKANIINTRDNLSFRITNDELIINGIKQANAIHQSILKKYVRKPGDNISLSYSNRR